MCRKKPSSRRVGCWRRRSSPFKPTFDVDPTESSKGSFPLGAFFISMRRFSTSGICLVGITRSPPPPRRPCEPLAPSGNDSPRVGYSSWCVIPGTMRARAKVWRSRHGSPCERKGMGHQWKAVAWKGLAAPRLSSSPRQRRPPTPNKVRGCAARPVRRESVAAFRAPPDRARGVRLRRHYPSLGPPSSPR